ncbi:MAG: PQQ-binding-like beta-propeller repeat protein, partial [Candidatus Coatesbacteria bacterium]|nr:PQQ-binding-like beta-propeller repeat protein [Candidatus Coatesbacteria bacterium]
MRDRLVVLLMLLFCLVGSAALGQEWFVRVNSDDINAISGEGDSLWAVTNGGGTLLWDLNSQEIDKFIKSQPDLYTDEDDTTATVRVWIRDELLTNSFTSVAVGPSDTVWFGCEAGINVANVSSGNAWEFTFATYTVANSPLPSNLITTIEPRPGTDEVWIGTRGGGVAVYDVLADDWTIYDTSDGLASNWVNCIYFDTHERAWIGTDHGVTQINMNFNPWAYMTYTTTDGLPSNYVTGVAEVPCCWIWFSTDNGAARVDIDDNWDTYGTWTDPSFVWNDLRGILLEGDDLFMWTEYGLIDYDLTLEDWSCFTKANTSGGIPSDDIRDVHYTGNFFMLATARGICDYGAVWTTFREQHLALNDVRAIACMEAEVWIGTYGAGANLLADWDANLEQPGTWDTYQYAPTDAIASNYINDIALDHRIGNGAVWFATNLGVSLFDKASAWTTYDTTTTGGALPSDRVMAVALDPRSTLGGVYRTWFATDNGLACYTTGSTEHWDTFTTSNSGLPSNYVTSLAGEVRDGEYYLWVGTNWGVAMYDLVNDTWVTYDASNSGILSENVRSLLVDPDGSIWIGTTNGISIFDLPSTWTSIRTSTPNSGLGSNAINAMAKGSGNNYWIATSRGLTKFDKSSLTGERFLPNNSGLIDGNVYDVCYQPCVGIWAATKGGVSILRQGVPILSDESVDPPVGGPQDNFTFMVHFLDFDGFAPSSATVVVGGTPYAMTLASGTADNGYYAAVVSPGEGHFSYFFYFIDVDGCEVRYPSSGAFDGPDVYDGYEPDNHCINAQLVQTDGVPTGWHNLIPIGTDEDWFYFRGEALIEYMIDVDLYYYAYGRVEIYRDDCSTFVAGDDASTPFSFVPDTGGYYFIRVLDDGTSLYDQSHYTLSVKGTQWPMLGHYYWHGSSVVALGPQAYCNDLTYATGPTIASTPAIDAVGNLYLGASYGRLVSLNPDLEERWVFDPAESDPVMCSPAISVNSDVVYYGTHDGYLYAIDSEDGTADWLYGPCGSILSSPVLHWDGDIIFATYDGTVYSLRPNGGLNWSRSVNCSFLGSSPVISQTDVIYIGSTEGILYAIGVYDGIIDWTYDVGYPIRSTPTVDLDGNIYFGADDGILYCLNPAGALRWTFETEGAIEGQGALGDPGRYYFGSTDEVFYALDCTATEAVVAWSRDVNGLAKGPVVDGRGRVFYGSGNGMVYSSTAFGAANWSRNVGPSVSSSLILGQNHDLYFVTGYNTVHGVYCDNVNPALTFPEVSPVMGREGDTFTYSVYYSDVNGDGPSKQYVV